MRELFIYYRAPRDEAARVVYLVREFQARLTAGHPGLAARLLCRPEVVDGNHTWMETYSMNAALCPDGIGAELADAIERGASCLAPCRIGPRHVEVFAPCA
jgi:hypothetical protein